MGIMAGKACAQRVHNPYTMCMYVFAGRGVNFLGRLSVILDAPVRDEVPDSAHGEGDVLMFGGVVGCAVPAHRLMLFKQRCVDTTRPTGYTTIFGLFYSKHLHAPI